MHIEYSDEQMMLRDSADKYLRDNYDFDRRQAVVRAGDGFSGEQWQTFAELGWLAMSFDEEFGGFGAGAVETMLLNEAFGRHLVLEPWLETVALAGGLLQAGGTDALRQRYLPGIAEGTVQGAFAHAEAGRLAGLANVETRATASGDGGYVISGRKVVVLNGPAADVILVTARTAGEPGDAEGLSLFAIAADAAGLGRRDYATYDGRHASDLTLDAVRLPAEALVGAEGGALPLIEKVLDHALLALCAEAVGAMEALLAATVDYTRQRKQFGQPIARFQVLRHRMADMYIHAELTRSLLMATAWKLDEGADDAPAMVAALKANVGKAGRYIGQNAIQLHGGIATTDELSVGHYFKRLTAIDTLFGARDYHLARYYRLTGASPAPHQQP
ncbi:MAG: acyl-CoA dehydrogenase family protein [Bacteroidales bacterium]|nr:acyl-CoA dehydrogenase family protein [Bacteroidales bacterium]